MTTASPIVTETAETAVIARFDDGGPNVVGHAALDALNHATDSAVESRLPLVVLGRDGMFSAGFDLKVFEEGMEPFGRLVGRGAEFLHRLVTVPVPVVVGATGHGVAMGSLMLLAADHRVAADGRFKIGLNEVSIGMALPHFAVALARHRLSKRHLLRATMSAEMYRPAEAVDAGYIDEVVEPDQVESTALTRAETLAGYSRGALAATKSLVRAELAADLAAAIEADKTAAAIG